MKVSKHRSRKRKNILVTWILPGVLGLVSLAFLAAGLGKSIFLAAGWELYAVPAEPVEGRTNGERQAQTAAAGQAGHMTNVAEESTWEEETVKRCKELYEEYKELLVLVNGEHILEEGAYEDTLRSICNGRLEASDYLYEDLVDLLAAAEESGFSYWIASAYRSRKRQQELIDEDVKRYMAQGMSYAEALERTAEYTMPAGRSEHETGLALDLLCSENESMDISQAGEAGNRWLAAHAHEYGFILRYPKDKEEITGILYEPWHFRYVGRETAAFLFEQGWTLEEFHAVLGN